MLLLIGVISNLAQGADPDPAPRETEVTTPTPTPIPTPEEVPTEEAPQADPAAAPSDQDVINAFQAYLDERASSGVMIAQAVTGVRFSDGEVLVIFDPEGTGVSPDVFGELNPFDNMAEFAGTPIAFANDEGQWLRQRVSSVRTQMADGTDLGSLTTAEIYLMGTGEQWTEGL